MNSSRFNHERAFSLGLVLLGWTLYGFFFASQNYVRQAYDGRNPNFQKDLGVWLTCGYSWAILTYPILLLARRFPFSRENWHRAFAVHIPASFFFAIGTLMIFTVIRAVMGHPYSVDRFQNLVVEEIHSTVLIYFGILGVRQAINYLLGSGATESKRPRPIEQSEPILNQGPDEIADRNGAGSSSAFVERFSIKNRGRILLIDANEIDLITSEGNYVKIHSNGTSHLMRDTMKGIEQKLDPKDFLRIRRSTIVRIDRIKELHPRTTGEFEIVLRNGRKLTSSRRYRKYFSGLLRHEK
jgi:DNA-binding LytR/AlgR family response regulator